MTINIIALEREAIPIELVGIKYTITPPKAALALKLAVQAKLAAENPSLVLDAIDEWLDRAFGKKEAEKVHKRIDDEKDLLDINHLMQLMEAVIELTTGNPTTSPSASPASQSTTGPTSTGGQLASV